MDSQSQGGSKMDISQGSQCGRGKNKCFWTRDEEWAFVHGLLELSVDPLWKAERNFKGEFFVKLERMLNEKFSSCGLKAYPHIDSKTKWFRRQKFKNCHKGLWGVPFPYLDKLDKVFGPDRATGAALENFEEAVNGPQNETIVLDKVEENDKEEEEKGESVQSTRATPKNSKKGRKEPTPKGKGKKKASQCGIVD
ncbi:hypothetical protein Cgig2_011652 [Carnegiea gigantea]|uniref:Myb/SANT-like domain-containing protein n=1 Tax=Carnegiea gigantea TaxID=171969 RepID=A0A9Q1Q4X8_9CARY|nr:hypothetical protein Cgig2_011652 [Carnegiea gigantea]